MNRICRTVSILWVLIISLCFISNSVAWAVNDLDVYQRGFDKYNISAITGIHEQDLTVVAHQIRAYFNSSKEPLDVHTRIFGEITELFNPREVAHMQDVKGLVHWIYIVELGFVACLLLLIVVGLYIRQQRVLVWLAIQGLRGSSLAVGIVALVAVLSVGVFDWLFLIFHQISFANANWMLDPRRDYLIILFPQGFWFDATIFVALLTVSQAVVVGGVCALFLLTKEQGFSDIKRLS